MNRFLSLLLLVGSYSFLVPSASAFQKDAELAYMISFKEPAAHFAEVQLKLVSLDSARTTLVLPVWTPGYYKILDNPAHIIDFKVSTISGEPLQWHKIAKQMVTGKWTKCRSLCGLQGLRQPKIGGRIKYFRRKSIYGQHRYLHVSGREFG